MSFYNGRPVFFGDECVLCYILSRINVKERMTAVIDQTRYSPSSEEMNQCVPLTHPLAFSAPTPRPAVRARAGQLRRTRFGSVDPLSLMDDGYDVHSY